MKPVWMVVALVLLAGCGSATHAVRLDTGQGKPLVHAPSRGQEPVRLREDEFKQSLAKQARDVKPASHPLRRARALMFESWQEEVYLEWTGRRLVAAAPDARGPRLLPEQDELTRGYGRWCERNRHRGDCLSLLRDTPMLDADGRYTLAMAIAVDSVWAETKVALAELADPEAVRANIVSALAMYMLLWVLPEPVSKGLAATLTAGLIAYLGVDTVWGLIGGWLRLVEEVDRARSFEALREAGERYGKVMGRHAARAFVLLATAAIGNTAGLAGKGPGLAGYSRAAVLAETQGGFRLAAVGEVRSVAVSAEGTFTIALAPGALAMQSRVGPAPSDSTAGAVNVRPPAARHYAHHVKQGTVSKDVNSVIESRVDVNADISAIREGRALVGRTPGGEVSYTVHGRTYGAHSNGTLYPVQGDGIHVLDRGAFKALGVYNRFGDTPRAAQILDAMGVGAAERAKALEVWRTHS